MLAVKKSFTLLCLTESVNIKLNRGLVFQKTDLSSVVLLSPYTWTFKNRTVVISKTGGVPITLLLNGFPIQWIWRENEKDTNFTHRPNKVAFKKPSRICSYSQQKMLLFSKVYLTAILNKSLKKVAHMGRSF